MKPKQSRPLLRVFSVGGAFLLSMAVLTTFAEAQMRPEGPVDKIEIHQVATRLHLSVAQQGAFVRIVDDFQMSMEAVLDKYGVDPSESRPPPTLRVVLWSELQTNMAQMDEELAAVLTAEQFRAFRRLRRERILTR